MCGIFIAINKLGTPVSEAKFQQALKKLYMRGPDLQVIKSPQPNVVMGQTVLSLVGNVQNEVQGGYLKSESGRYTINFNGEIYNYQQLSRTHLNKDISADRRATDTHVLVELHDLYGVSGVPTLLDGMYAYAVYDELKNQLSITRDPQGEKSLFLYEDREWTIISSQINAILAFIPSSEFNVDSLKDYFYTRHFLQVEDTAYKNIRQLVPGSVETLDLNSFQWTRKQVHSVFDWISEDTYNQYGNLSLDELAEELDSILAQCVKEMVPIDRKVASVLSGGIDSSLLSSYTCRYTDPEVLVAVNHIGKDEISLDLSGFETHLNKRVDTLNVDKQMYSERIGNAIANLGSPLLSHSFVGQEIQSDYVHQLGCKAMFGGEGADELFGGYQCYLAPISEAKTCPSLYSGYFPADQSIVQHDTQKLESELAVGWQRSQDAYGFLKSDERVVLAQMLSDLVLQVSNVAMRGADIMSMMHSVETRSIFMRKPIVQFALNLPIRAKLSNDENPLMRTKLLLKKVFLKHFPEQLLVQKQGFSGFPNESQYLLGDYSEFKSLDLLEIPMLNLNSEHSREQLWKLINIEHFLRSSAN